VGALAGVAATFVALALMAMVPNGIFAIAVLLVMAIAGVYLYGTSAHKSLRGGMGAALLVALAALSFLALIGPLVGFVDDGSAQSRTDDLIMGWDRSVVLFVATLAIIVAVWTLVFAALAFLRRRVARDQDP